MPALGRDPEELRFRAERRWGPRLKWRCLYCGRKPATQVDHLFPFWSSRDSSARNLVPACPKCNNAKNGHQPAAWMEAVGVDPTIRNLLFIQFDTPLFRVGNQFTPPVVSLDYAAGALLNDIPGQNRSFQGKLG